MDEAGRPLKIREAADELGVDYGSLRGAIEQGLLKAEQVDGSYRIRREDLDAYRDLLFARPTPRAARPAPPKPEPELSPELAAARAFAEQARRWARRSTPPPPPRPRKTQPMPEPETEPEPEED